MFPEIGTAPLVFGIMAPPSVCWMRTRITFASIGLFVGVSIFFCFGLVYNNWNCAMWGLLSGVFAGLTLLVHVGYQRDQWQHSAHHLRPLMIMGGFIQLAGICGFVAYICTAIMEHQTLTGYGRGYYVTAVWCFMTWKWGFLLFYFSKQYKDLFQELFHSNPDIKYEPI